VETDSAYAGNADLLFSLATTFPMPLPRLSERQVYKANSACRRFVGTQGNLEGRSMPGEPHGSSGGFRDTRFACVSTLHDFMLIYRYQNRFELGTRQSHVGGLHLNLAAGIRIKVAAIRSNSLSTRVDKRHYASLTGYLVFDPTGV